MYAALTYFYDHRPEILDLLVRRDDLINEMEERLNQPGLSRAELLTRRLIAEAYTASETANRILFLPLR